MQLDALLVKYWRPDLAGTVEPWWQATWAALGAVPGLRLLVHDNNAQNIGLVRARNLLLAQATAPVVLLCDFDLELLAIDWPALAGALEDPGIGMVQPRTVTGNRAPSHCPAATVGDWELVGHPHCHFMLLRRDTLAALGGFDERYHTAYADLALLNRLVGQGRKIVQHNRSLIRHYGASGLSPHRKQTIWQRDWSVYTGEPPCTAAR